MGKIMEIDKKEESKGIYDNLGRTKNSIEK